MLALSLLLGRVGLGMASVTLDVAEGVEEDETQSNISFIDLEKSPCLPCVRQVCVGGHTKEVNQGGAAARR